MINKKKSSQLLEQISSPLMLLLTLLSYPYYRDYCWKYECLETFLRKLLYLKFDNFNLTTFNLNIQKLGDSQFENS